jgi:DNA polymerase-3 subunit alpha
LQAASDLQDDRRRGQKSIFDMLEPADAETSATNDLPEGPDWSPSIRLKNEKEALDFYLSSHPLAELADEIRRFASHTIEDVRDLSNGAKVLIGGMVTQLRFMNVKKARSNNTRYVRCKFEDFTGQLESMMWPDEFVKYKDFFVEDRIMLAEGVIEQRGEEPQFVISRVLTIDTARKELTKGLVLRLELGRFGVQNIEEAAKVLRKTPGPCPVYVQISDGVGKKAVLRAGERFRVNPAEVRLGELESLFGPNCVMFTGK